MDSQSGSSKSCPCAQGSPGDYEGPLRDCPIHGVDEMEEALRGMLESYELVMQAPFSDAVKESVRGYFLGAPEAAHAALSKAGSR